MFDRIIKLLKNFPTDQIIREAVNETQSFAEQLNIDQMKQGINSRDSPITPEYADATKRIKARKGQPTDRVTLRDTGAFQRNMSLKMGNKDFDINSSDPKTAKLVEKYGKDIFGLTGTSKDELSEEIKPILDQKTFEYLTR